MLLSPTLLRQLDALSLHARRAFTGTSKGEKRSTKRGSSVEFADFRAYNFGDDLRRVDWNAYGRFEKLYLKMFMEEEDLDITLLLDASASMSFDQGTKWQRAREIAGALGYIGLTHYDRISAHSFNEKILQSLPPCRSRSAVPGLLRWMENLNSHGSTDWTRVAKNVALRAQRPGLAIVLSDFLMPEGYEDGLKILAARGFEIIALQILDREELEPQMTGDWKLTDVENGTTREVSMSGALLKIYQQNLDEHCGGLRTFCLRYGMRYSLVATDISLENTLLRLLRGDEVVR